jgi:hypothetical protein
MAILATAGVALLAWANTSLQSIARLRDRTLSNQLVRSSVLFMQDVDIFHHPTGEASMGDYALSWRADPVEPPIRGRTIAGTPSDYQMALFRADVKILLDAEQVGAFAVTLVGFEHVPPDAARF